MSLNIETYNYKCTVKGVYKRNLNEQDLTESWSWISRPIYISKIHRTLHSGELIWTVRFLCSDGWQEDTIARIDVTERNILALLKKGADITTWKTKMIINYLVESEKQVPIAFQHSHLGWIGYKKQYYYAHQSLTSINRKIKSEYIGEFNLSKSGSRQNWEEIVKEYVIGNSALELALCMGFSAILVGYINCILGLHIDSLIFHISGNSTIGKTSAATVAVSGFGDSREGARSLIQSFNGTDNALTNLMANNNGIPLVCDETSLSLMGTQKLVNVLYTWAKNISKLKLDKESNPRPRSTWATTIITTGEGSLIDQINQNEGIRARVFEFKNIQWTQSAAHSNALVKGFSKNYGHGIEPFILHLLSYLPKEVEASWEDETDQMEAILPDSKFRNRVGKKFALIILTAKYLNKTFDFDLNIEAIRSLLVQQEEESIEERVIGPKVVEQLKEWLLMNQKHFVLNKVQPAESQQIWGRIDVFKSNSKTVAYILPSAFEQMLKQYQYSDKSVVLRELDQMNALVKETDAKQNKYHTRRVIKGYESSKNGLMVYGIEFDSAFLQVDGMFDPTRRKGKKVLMVDEREPETVDINDM